MELRVHLKVCEGCGCLWYRLQDEITVYCTACRERFKDFPTPESRKRRGRPKKTTLPTVLAVHAPLEGQGGIRSNWEKGHRIAATKEGRFAGARLQTRYIRSSRVETQPPEKTPLALLASQSAALSTPAVLVGGVQ